jgi:hypothetical protein
VGCINSNCLQNEPIQPQPDEFPHPTGTLELWNRAGGCWKRFAGPWQAQLGASGVSRHHREGDGTTPEGAYGFGKTIFGVLPDPGVKYHYHRLVCGDWWDEDPSSRTYNTFVHLVCGAQPVFKGNSEALWLSPIAYAWGAQTRSPISNGAICSGIAFLRPTASANDDALQVRVISARRDGGLERAGRRAAASLLAEQRRGHPRRPDFDGESMRKLPLRAQSNMEQPRTRPTLADPHGYL